MIERILAPLLLIACLGLAGCPQPSGSASPEPSVAPSAAASASAPAKQNSPHETFMAFEAVAIEGGTVEARMAFLTEAERGRVEARFEQMIKAGKSREEVLELYRKIEVEGAKAYDLSLVEEKIEGSSAKLVYGMKRKDGKKDDASKQTVSLKLEGGEWRIDEVVISLD